MLQEKLKEGGIGRRHCLKILAKQCQSSQTANRILLLVLSSLNPPDDIVRYLLRILVCASISLITDFTVDLILGGLQSTIFHVKLSRPRYTTKPSWSICEQVYFICYRGTEKW